MITNIQYCLTGSKITGKDNREIVVKVIKSLLRKSEAIAMNINEFNDLLQTGIGKKWFEPITDRKILNTGHYANVNGKPVYCIKSVRPEIFIYGDNKKVKQIIRIIK
jgi:hypothetical protein